MLRTIIRKELIGNLTSLRFILTFLLIVAVFVISGIIFVSKYESELVDYRNAVNKNLTRLEEMSKNLNEIPYYVQSVRKKPKVSQLICEGFEKSLPNSFRMDAFTFEFPEVENRANFLFPRFADIDWTFIIAFILSFVALLMTFDSFSAEKERGTLSLMMSNSIPRDKVILGKFISGMLTLMIPLFVGLLLNVIVVSLAGVSLIGEGYELKILAFLLLSLLYLAVFVLLGILVSSLTSRSSSSIVILLFIWVILSLVIPAFGRIAAEKLVDVPIRTEVQRQIRDSREQIWTDTEKYGKNAGNWGSGIEVNYQGRARLKNAETEAKNQIKEHYMNKIVSQITIGRNITRVSPTAMYQFASESIFGTGVARFRNLNLQLKRYKEILVNFIMDEDREDPQSIHLLAEGRTHRIMLSSKPVDFNVIPKFEEKDVSMDKALKDALWDITFLAIINVFLCLLVYVSFLRADVRQK